MRLLSIPKFHKQQPQSAAQGPSDTRVDAHQPPGNRAPDPGSPLARRPPSRKTSQKPSVKSEKNLLQTLCFTSGASTSRKNSLTPGGRLSPDASPTAGVSASRPTSEMPAEAPATQATLGQAPVRAAHVPRRGKTLAQLFKETKEMHEAEAPLGVFSDAMNKPASSVQAHLLNVGGTSTHSEIEELEEPGKNAAAPEGRVAIEEKINEGLSEAEQDDIDKPDNELSIPWAHDANPKNLFWQKIDESHKQDIFHLFSDNNDIEGIALYEKIQGMEHDENSGASETVSQDPEKHNVDVSPERKDFLKKIEFMEEMERHLLQRYQAHDLRKLRNAPEPSASLKALMSRFQEASRLAASGSESPQGLPISAPPTLDYFRDASTRASPDLEHFEFANGSRSATSDPFQENTRARYEEAVEIEVNKQRVARQAKSLDKPSPKGFLHWLRG